jgi:hypothetical protein
MQLKDVQHRRSGSKHDEHMLAEEIVTQQEQDAKDAEQYRRECRNALIGFFIFGALALFFASMWLDVYTSQADIPIAMRTPRQEWAQWPAIPAVFFGMLAFGSVRNWKESRDWLKLVSK